MPRTIRFPLDENCHPAIAEGPRRRGIDATTSREEGLLGATDEEQLAHATAQARVLVTRDVGFLRIQAAGRSHREIAYARPGTYGVGGMIDALELIWEVMGPREIDDKVEYL